MRFNELPDSERLAIMQALYNVIGEQVSTKNPDSLRALADQSYKDLYELTGSKSFDVKVNNNVVGTYSIKFSKPKDSTTSLDFEVYDMLGLAEWFSESADKDVINRFAALNLERFAEFYFKETGEMPDGCDIEKHITPAVEKQYIGGMLKVDCESVATAINELLPGVAGLLTGGEDDRDS